MPAFVTGGTGIVGAHVVRALLARGTRVRCLARPASRRDNLEGLDVEVVEGDLSDVDGLRRALDGSSHLFHCAADYRLWAPDPAVIYRTNVEGTDNVFAAAADCGVERIVYTSSVGALGLEPDGSAANEETAVELADMIGHYKRSKYLAERRAEEWAKRGLPVVIVNPSTPVGELDLKPTPTGRILVDFLNRRMPAYVDSGLNLIDVRDVAEGHLAAAERGRIGVRYILGNRNLRLHEIFQRLAALSGLPRPKIRLPLAIPLAAAAVDTGWSQLTGRPPRVPLEAVRMAGRKMFFDSSKAVRELGLPQSPIDAALERAIVWYRENGYA